MGARALVRTASVVLVTAVAAAVPAIAAQAAYSPSPRPTYSANSTVFAMAVTADRVYIGGAFTRVIDPVSGTNYPRQHLAAFDRVTGQLLSWSPSVDDDVRSLAVDPADGRVFVGGYFTTVNGQSQTRLAALESDGSLVQNWDPTPSGAVRSIVIDGPDLYLAGLFGRIGTVGRAGLARLDKATGALDPNWKVVASGGRPRVIEVAPNGNDLIVGGAFTTLNGAARSFLGSVALSDGTVTDWTPPALCSDCAVFDVAADGSGNLFTAVGGSGGGRLASYSLATGANAWFIRGDGNVQAVAVKDGIVYAGGHFGPSFGRNVRHQLAAVDATTGTILPWNPGLGGNDYPGVWTLSADDDFLRAGGGFATVGGGPPARFAEFPTV